MRRNGTHKTKEQLQAELDEKRNDIASTFDEIKDTLTEEVRGRKESVKQAMDWKFYVKRNPTACLGGALAVGFFVGKALGKRLMENHDHDYDMRDRFDDMADRSSRKVDEWNRRSHGQGKWRARSGSMMAAGTDMVMRELMKTAQRMIIPAVIATVTGKMAADEKAEQKVDEKLDEKINGSVHPDLPSTPPPLEDPNARYP